MLDDLHSDGAPRSASRASGSRRSFADREVPISRPGVAIPDAVHAWLDGDATESSARRLGSASHVDFWKGLDADLVGQRHLRAPVDIEMRIMAAIPLHVPQVITPWWRRELVVTPSSALLAALAMMAIAAGATALILR